MIITISGLAGSGKDTLGKELAEELGFRKLSPTFKDLAKKEGVSLIDFQKKAATDSDIDKKFDRYLKGESAKQDCVVTTWLGPWMLDADLRVYLFAPMKVRAERLARRDKISIEEATEHIKEREEQNRKRYLKVYGIDIYDTSNFDICLNSGKYSPKELCEIILNLIKLKKKY
ncbi:cytidylate kinase family protein [Candidatus Micrarchaeota archaeon]|nr:cytidylate kinase family protein [Candidatus Micrarchaeota archaeon]